MRWITQMTVNRLISSDEMSPMPDGTNLASIWSEHVSKINITLGHKTWLAPKLLKTNLPALNLIPKILKLTNTVKFGPDQMRSLLMYRGITRASNSPSQTLSKAQAAICAHMQSHWIHICEAFITNTKQIHGIDVRLDYTAKTIQEVIASWTGHHATSLTKGDFSRHYETIPHDLCIEALVWKFEAVMTYHKPATNLHLNLKWNTATHHKCDPDRPCFTPRQNQICLNSSTYRDLLKTSFSLATASFSDIISTQTLGIEMGMAASGPNSTVLFQFHDARMTRIWRG